ncbi:MAG TPA: molybdopterin-dependent oxidoreductase, partial [Actinomycetota bacterium]|nr:molybdopterin-dependent oxidoreductase [Actinomycetota bacterium]
GGALGWVARRLGGPQTDVPIAAPATPARVPTRAPFPDVPGLSPEVTSVDDHYVVDVNLLAPSVEAADWRLRVYGAVDRPLEPSFDELQRDFEVVEDFSVLTCISNEVGGDLVGHSAWRGVRVADVLARAGVRSDAVDVVFRSVDGYSDSIPIEVARNPSVLLAFGQNGRALTQEHGFPCRVRIPPIYGMKNVKWLQSIEVVASDHLGYWQRRGWSDDAVVRTSCRIDAIGDGRSARAGEATWVAGVAWAGDRGVDAVEVSTDGGRTWTRAELKEPVARASWRLWAYRWTPDAPGPAQIVCRAVDGRGARQTAAVAPPHPDGATGYHRVEVEVA